MVPASNAMGSPNRLKPQSTILAEEAILLTTRMVTKTARIRSKKLYCFKQFLALGGLSSVDTITARGRDRNDKKMHICLGMIPELMPHLRRDLYSFPFA